MASAAWQAVEPLESRVMMNVDPAAPPAFMIGVWQQNSTTMATWKNRNANTLFEVPECQDPVAWANTANTNNLWVVREPRRKAPYNSGWTDPNNFENTCKDAFPATNPATGGAGTATWSNPTTIWDPAADVAAHPNLLGFLQMDEPNIKYVPFRSLQDVNGAHPSAGTPFYYQDMAAWLKAKYSAWKTAAPSKPIFLTFSGDHLDNTENNLQAFYKSLGLDNNADGRVDQLQAADAVGLDWYPINNHGSAENPITDPLTGQRTRGEADIDWALEQRTEGQLGDRIRRMSPGVQFDALQDGLDRHKPTQAGWGGYSQVPNFYGQRNFAIIESSWQHLQGDGADADTVSGDLGRQPTKEEVRGQVWDSILRGANAIVYFPGANGDGTPADVGTEITTQNARINQYADVLISTQRAGAGDANHGNVQSDNVAIQGAWRRVGSTDYYLVENMSHDTLTNATFQLIGTNGATTAFLDPRGANQATTIQTGGYITANFAPYETKIYSLTGGVVNPSEFTIQAEAFNGSNSPTSVTIIDGGTHVDNIDNDDFLRFDAVNFDGATYTNFTANLAVDPSRAGGHVEVWLDARSTAGGGTKIGDLTTTSTGGFTTFSEEGTALTSTPTGTHNLFLLFKGTITRLAVMDYIKFSGTGGGGGGVNRNARSPIEAESLNGSNNSTSVTVVGNYVDDINNDDFLRFDNVDFGTGGLTTFDAKLAVDAGHAGGSIQVWVDARSTAAGGTQIGTLNITSTGGYGTFAEELATLTDSSTTGVHTLFLLFKGSVNRLAQLDWVKFS